jgi:hypothetical protein
VGVGVIRYWHNWGEYEGNAVNVQQQIQSTKQSIRMHIIKGRLVGRFRRQFVLKSCHSYRFREYLDNVYLVFTLCSTYIRLQTVVSTLSRFNY